MLWVDKDTVAICKDEWSILLGEDGKPYQDEYKSNIKYGTTDLFMFHSLVFGYLKILECH